MQYGQTVGCEERFSRFIPYTHHVDKSTLKTKDGYFLKIIKIDGMPFETADQCDLNQMKNVRSTLLRGLSNSRLGIYHHIIRTTTDEIQKTHFENEWCQALNDQYEEQLSKRRMFVNEQYLTIICRPKAFTSSAYNSLFKKIDKNGQREDEIETLKILEEATDQILSTLAPYKARVLTSKITARFVLSEPLSFLFYLLNFEQRSLDLPQMSAADYLAAKRISFGKESFEVRGPCPEDIKLGAMLSIKEYTQSTGPGMLDAFLRLPYEFVITQSFGFVGRQAALNAMHDTKRKLRAGEQGAASLEEEIDHAIDDLASGYSSFGEHHLSLCVLGRSEKELSSALSDCSNAFVNLGLVATREDVNLQASFFAQLPGNFSYIARRSLISNKNFAGFASLHSFPNGQKEDNHWGNAITLLETTSGTPYWFNFHERDVGNFTVIGPTGTGKTVLLTFLHAQSQKLKPRSFYFDKDHGAEIYLRAIGGTYTSVEAGRPASLNPLQLPDTQENRAFLRDWLKLLVTVNNDTPISSEDMVIIADAVEANYEEPAEHRRLSYLSELLGGHEKQHGSSLYARIALWHSEGERSWLFDNEQDALSFDAYTIGFDLTSILDDPVSRTPWLMYVFHRIAQTLDGTKTIIMLDEGWKLLDDPAFSARIKDWMKTIRKQNGIIGFATQSAKDAINSSVGDAIIEQSPTQIFLPNPRASEKDYCDGFGLSLHELEMIRALTPQSRCFLIRHGTDSVIAKLDLSGLQDFMPVLSGRIENVKFMNEFIDVHGHDPSDWLPPFLEKVAS